MSNPTFVQSQIASSDASVWNPFLTVQATTLTITLPNVQSGNIVQVIMALFCDTVSLEAEVDGAGVLSDTLSQSWATINGVGLFKESGAVGSIWNASWAQFSTSGTTTITVQFIANSPPITPYLAVAAAIEYHVAGDSGVDPGEAFLSATSPVMVGPIGSTNSSAVVLGVAVNASSPVTANGGFTTRQSATGLPNSSSAVLADMATDNGTFTLTSAGTGSFAMGGFGNDVFLVVTAPTCTLTTDSISDAGIPPWQSDFNFDPINTDDIYSSVILDSNGNIQYATTGGVSGSTEPTWATTLGDITNDGDVVWVRAAFYTDASWVHELPLPIFAKFGSSVGLTWTSTGADSVSLNGGVGTVAFNGSGTFNPTLGMAGEYVNTIVPGNSIWIGAPSVFVQQVYGCAGYVLSVSGPGGSAFAAVPIVLITIFDSFLVTTFAPVNIAAASPEGACSAAPPISMSLPLWGPNIPYNEGAQVLDSNGNGQIALDPGSSAGIAPTWAGVGGTTTETTGLAWQNFGMIYGGFLTQRGFGPGWSGYSVLGFGYDSMVIPQNITDIGLYQANHAYALGDVVYPSSSSTFGNFIPGLPLIRCIVAGTSGPAVPEVPVQGSNLIGQAVPDGSLSGGTGSTLVWQNLGPLVIYLQWQGTTIPAPSGYGPPVELGSGPLPQVFDGNVQTTTMAMNRSIQFLTTPGDFNPTISPQDTVPIPDDPVHWFSTFLGTGFINSALSAGFTHTMAGCWAIFSSPLSFASESPGSGTITVVKATVPPGETQVFNFSPNWGPPFTLTDGQSQGSGPLAPGTYSVVEAPVFGWTTEVNPDPSNIVVTEGSSTTVTFTNTAPPTGIVTLRSLDDNVFTDNGAAIDSRYVTYAFADASDRERLQMGQGRVIYPYALANIDGEGQWNLTVWPETLGTPANPNPYPATQAPFTLEMTALDDVNIPLNVTGNRAFLQIDSDGVAGTHWSISRLDLGIADDPRMRISGR